MRTLPRECFPEKLKQLLGLLLYKFPKKKKVQEPFLHQARQAKFHLFPFHLNEIPLL